MKIKKISAFVSIALLILSIMPAAFADDTVAANTDAVRAKRIAPIRVDAKPVMTKEDFMERQREFYNTAMEKCDETEKPEECREELRERAQNIVKLEAVALNRIQEIKQDREAKIENFKEMLQEEGFKKFDPKKEYKAREIAKTKLAKAKTAYLAAKENYEKSKEKFEETKAKFQNVKQRLKACQEEGEDCDQLEEETLESAKDHLLRIADVILKHLDKLKARVDSNDSLDEDEAADILDNIEERADEIEALKADVEAAETKKNVQKAAENFKAIWETFGNKIKTDAGMVVNARIGGIIVKSEQLKIKLLRIEERMEGTEVDNVAMANITSLIDEFDVFIGNANSSYIAARGNFTAAKEMEEPDPELIETGQELMKEAHAALKDAQSILRKILTEFRKAGHPEVLYSASDKAVAHAEERPTANNKNKHLQEVKP